MRSERTVMGLTLLSRSLRDGKPNASPCISKGKMSSAHCCEGKTVCRCPLEGRQWASPTSRASCVMVASTQMFQNVHVVNACHNSEGCTWINSLSLGMDLDVDPLPETSTSFSYMYMCACSACVNPEEQAVQGPCWTKAILLCYTGPTSISLSIASFRDICGCISLSRPLLTAVLLHLALLHGLRLIRRQAYT